MRRFLALLAAVCFAFHVSLGCCPHAQPELATACHTVCLHPHQHQPTSGHRSQPEAHCHQHPSLEPETNQADQDSETARQFGWPNWAGTTRPTGDLCLTLLSRPEPGGLRRHLALQVLRN